MRDIEEEQGREILEYIRGKKRMSSDEIADALKLNTSHVNVVLMGLWEEGEIVEPRD